MEVVIDNNKLNHSLQWVAEESKRRLPELWLSSNFRRKRIEMPKSLKLRSTEKLKSTTIWPAERAANLP